MKRLFGGISFLGLMLVAVLATANVPNVPADQQIKLSMSESLGKLPLRFEQNEGQISDEVKFLTRGKGYAMYFTPTESVMVLSKVIESGRPEIRSHDPAKDMTPQKIETSVVRMEVVGGNKEAKIKGQDKLPGTSNYFLGNDQSKWRQGVANYKKVHYEEVYAGIDLVYYGNQRKLEYDFVVKPGADPKKIELNFKGAEKISLDKKGNLVLKTKVGDVVQQAPVIFQTIDGKKQSVKGGYVVKENNRVAFKLAQYDTEQELVIDPVLGFSTYLGGNGNDSANGMVVDSAGSVFVTGNTTSTDFDVLNEIEGDSDGATTDVFVLKIVEKNNVPSLAYSTYLGGSSNDIATDIELDSLGDVYVTGYTRSQDFDVLNEIEGASGLDDVFVFKLTEDTPNVPTLAYSTYLGGLGSDRAVAIAVASPGTVYVTGTTLSKNFDVLNEIEGDSAVDDVFVFKLIENTPHVPTLAYSTYLGGSSTDFATDIALDSSENVYVTGYTRSFDFDVLNEIEGKVGSLDVRTVIVFKLTENTPNVPSLAYSTYLGGSGLDFGYGIAVDSSGSVYVTGDTHPPFFDPKTNFDLLNEIKGLSGGVDIFVFKLEQINNVPSLAFSTLLGGSGHEYSRGIFVDSSGDIFITGNTASPNFDLVNEIKGYQGGSHKFVTHLTQTNNFPSIVFSTYMGGGGSSFVFSSNSSIVADSSGRIYVAGSTRNSNFDLLNEIEGDSVGSDSFIFKLGSAVPDTTPPIITLIGNNPMDAPYDQPYVDPGATAVDVVDGPVAVTVASNQISPTVFEAVYSATDSSGNSATATRTINLGDNTPPVITILGDNPLDAPYDQPYIDPWATAIDAVDGALEVTAVSNQLSPVQIEVVYSSTDVSGNTATATRIINLGDNTPPVITVLGDNPVVVVAGQPYVDAWATAVDAVDGTLEVTAVSNQITPLEFEIVYSAVDISGNTSTATRTVFIFTP